MLFYIIDKFKINIKRKFSLSKYNNMKYKKNIGMMS